MLRPDERQHLLELLRPPTGSKLDIAVGTTFSLDLLSALMLPLSFAFFDWEHEDGELVADPLALLEALRRYGDRFTIFCQSGQIRLPQVSAPGHVPRTMHLRRKGAGRRRRISPEGVGAALHCGGRRDSVSRALPEPESDF